MFILTFVNEISISGICCNDPLSHLCVSLIILLVGACAYRSQAIFDLLVLFGVVLG